MKDEKYQKLTDYLQNCNQKEILLTFAEIEEILGFSLDASAFQYKEFWANCTTSTKAYSWMDAGYEIAETDFKKHTLLFKQKDWL
mgnify:CR=1 FL=1